jgi:antitoxin component YwqK of YwqJK toxin-antitoxin module
MATMKLIIPLLILLTISFISCSQKHKYPGQFELRGYKIGDRVDTILFKKYEDLYFPNYLDGWTMDNVSQLPEKYHGLPIAIWQSKKDSSIALTLLNDFVLNLTVSYLADEEKVKLQTMFTDKFGGDGKQKSYEQTHPLQDWITYWNLITWETKDAIVQLGNSEMRKPNQAPRKEIKWNLVYSDFLLENKIINDFKEKLFSNKADSVKFVQELNAHKNKMNPPSNGPFTVYFDNAKLKEKGNYKNGKKNGLWETWFENGEKEDSATYNNDELIGKRLMWFSNGQLQLESYWGKNETRIGIWKSYFKNGKSESVFGFDYNGEFHGTHLQFFESGNKKRETHYEHGKESSDITYDEQGKRTN